MYNKRVCEKTNDKKILHKIGKQWCTISIAMLSLLGGGVIAGHAVHAASIPQQTIAQSATSAHNDNSQSTAGRIQQSASTLHANLMATAPVSAKPVQPATNSQQGSQLNTKPTQSAEPKPQMAANHNVAVQAPVQNARANQSTMPNNSQNNQGNVNLRYRDITVNTPIQFLDIHGKPYSNGYLPFGSNGGVQLDQNGVWHYQKNNVSVNETNGNTTVPFISYDGADAQGHGLSNSDGNYHGYWGFDVKGLRNDINSAVKPLTNLNAISGLHIHADKNNNITYQNNDKYLVMQSEPSYDKADFNYTVSNGSDDALDNSSWSWTTNDITEGSVYQNVPAPSTVFSQLKMKDIDDPTNRQAYLTKYAHDGNLPVSHFFNPNFNEGAQYKPGHTTLATANSDYYGLEPRKYPRKMPVYLEDVTNKDENMIEHGAVTKGYIEDKDATYGANNAWSVNDNDVQNDFKTNDGSKNPFNSKIYTLRSMGNLVYNVGTSQSDVINDGYPDTDYVYNPYWYHGSLTDNNQHIGWYDNSTKTVTNTYQANRIPVIEYYHHNPIPPNGINVDIPSFWSYVRYWNPEYNPNYKQGDKLSDYYLPYSSNASDNNNDPYSNDKNINDDEKTSVSEHNGHKYYANNIATFYNYGDQNKQAPANAVVKEHFSNAQGMYQNMYYTNDSDTYYVWFKTIPERNGHYAVTPEILNHNDSDLSVSMVKQSQPKIGDIRIVKNSNGKLMAIRYEGTASGSTMNRISDGELEGYPINPFYPSYAEGESFNAGTTNIVVPFDAHAPQTQDSDLFLPAGTPIWQIMGATSIYGWPKYLGDDNGSYYTGISTMNQEVNIYPENDNAAMVSPFSISSARYQGEANANDLIAPNVHGQIIKDGMITINSNTNQVSNQNLSLPAGAPLISFGDSFDAPVPNEPGTSITMNHYLIYHNGQYYLAYDSATGQYINPVNFNPDEQANKLITPIRTKHSYLYNSYKMPDLNVYAYPQHATLGYTKAYGSDSQQDQVGPTKTITIYPTDKIIYDKTAKGLRIQSYHHVDDDLVNHNNGDGLMVGTSNGDHTNIDDNPESGIILPKPANWKYNWDAQYSNGGSWYQPGVDRRNEWRQPGTDTIFELGTGNKQGYALVNVGQPKQGANINVFYFKLDTGQEFNSNTAQKLVPVSWQGDLTNSFSIYPFLPKTTKQADGTYMINPSEQKKFDGYKYLVSYTLPAGGIQPNTSQSAFVYLSKIDPNAQQEPLTIHYVDPQGRDLGHDIKLSGESNDTIDQILAQTHQKLWNYKAEGGNEAGLDFDNRIQPPYDSTDYLNDDSNNPIFASSSYDNGNSMFGNHRRINIVVSGIKPPKVTTKTVPQSETVTHTVYYVDKQGKQIHKPQTFSDVFTRNNTVNAQTGQVVKYGSWKLQMYDSDGNPTLTSDYSMGSISAFAMKIKKHTRPKVRQYNWTPNPDVTNSSNTFVYGTVKPKLKAPTVTILYQLDNSDSDAPDYHQTISKINDKHDKDADTKLAQLDAYLKSLKGGFEFTTSNGSYYIAPTNPDVGDLDPDHHPNYPDSDTVNNLHDLIGDLDDHFAHHAGKDFSEQIYVKQVGSIRAAFVINKGNGHYEPVQPNMTSQKNTSDKSLHIIPGTDVISDTGHVGEASDIDGTSYSIDTILAPYVPKGFEFPKNSKGIYHKNIHDHIINKKQITFMDQDAKTDNTVEYLPKTQTILIEVVPKPQKPTNGKITVQYVDKATGKAVKTASPVTEKQGSAFDIQPYVKAIPSGYIYNGIQNVPNKFINRNQIATVLISKKLVKGSITVNVLVDGQDKPYSTVTTSDNSGTIFKFNPKYYQLPKGYVIKSISPQPSQYNNSKQTVTIIAVKPQPKASQITVQYVDKATNQVINTAQPVTRGQGDAFDIQPYTKTIPVGYNYDSTANVPAKFTDKNQTATIFVTKKPARGSITVQVIIDGQTKPYSTKTTTDNAGTPFKFNVQNYQMPKGYTIKSVTGQPSQYMNINQTVTVTVVKPKPKTSTITVQYVDKVTGKAIKTVQPVTETVGSPFNAQPYTSSIPQGYTYDSLKDTTDKFTEKDQTVTVLVNKKVAPKPAQPKKPNKPSVAMGTITVDYIDNNSGRTIKSVTVSKPVGYQFNSHNYISELPQGYRYRRTTGDTTQFMPSAQTVDIYIGKSAPKPNSSASQPAHSASAKPQSSDKAKPSSAAKPSSSMGKSTSSSSAKPASSASSAKSSSTKKPSSSASAPSSSAKPASKATSQSASSSSSAKGSASAKPASSQSVVPKSKASSAQSKSTVPSSKAVPASSSGKPKSTSSSTQPSSSAKAPNKPSSTSAVPGSFATPSNSSAIMPSSTSSASSSASQPSEATSQSVVVPQPSSVSVQPKSSAISAMSVSERTKSTSNAGVQSLSASLSANRIHDEHVLHSLEDNDKHLTKHNAVKHVRSELASATSQLNYDKHALSMAKSAQSAIDEAPTANHTSQYAKARHTVNQPASYGTFNKQKASLVRTAQVPQVTKAHMNGHKATNNGYKKLPQTNETTSHMSIVAVFTATLGSFLAIIGKAFDRKHNK